MTCTECLQPGHNKRTCPVVRAKREREATMPPGFKYPHPNPSGPDFEEPAGPPRETYNAPMAPEVPTEEQAQQAVQEAKALIEQLIKLPLETHDRHCIVERVTEAFLTNGDDKWEDDVRFAVEMLTYESSVGPWVERED